MENSRKTPNRQNSSPSPSVGDQAATPPSGFFGRQRWAPFVLPLLAFVLSGQLEPRPPAEDTASAESAPPADETADARPAPAESPEPGLFPYRWYPLVYTARIALTLAVAALALPAYRMFRLRVSWLAVAVGTVGVILWIGLCSLGLEQQYILPALSGILGESGGRAAYNPLEQLDGRPAALAGFLAVRFFGLALLVPLIEEFFVRGFLMRFVQEADWWQVPIGAADIAAWIAVIVYAVLTHPGEMLAAAVWFSLVTWLITRTRNIWDAVAAHAVTNLLLGVYVVSFRQWELW